MILSLLCACQLAASAPTPPLVVRVGDRVRAVPMVAHPEGGAAVRGDLLLAALEGSLVDEGNGRYRAVVGDSALSVQLLAPFAVAGATVIPLPSAPFRNGKDVYLPLALASDVMPRALSGVLFDAERLELRRFAAVARVAATPRAGTTAAGTASAQASAATAPPPLLTPPARAPARKRIVVVDAGHGGRDPGTTINTGSRRVAEKVVALAVAFKVRDALVARGVEVFMTRTTDTLIGLHDRGPIANRANGDLFVSIHTNAANPKWKNASSARGFETYFLAEAKTEDEARVAAMENEAIKFETTVETSGSDPLGFILRDMAQNEHLRESLKLASLAQEHLDRVHPGPNRGVKQAPLSVLVRSFMPSMLVELGFGSNPREAEFLLSPARQAELAEAIADACVAFLAQYDRKIGLQSKAGLQP